MSLETLKSSMQSRLKTAPPLGYVVDLDLGDDGHVFLDGSDGTTQVLDATDKTPDTVLTVSLETMEKIVSGDTDPNMAVLMGKMKVSGKMGVALKLASYLE